MSLKKQPKRMTWTLNVSKRIDQSELMDNHTYPQRVLEKVLWFLEFTNRFFGGTAVVLNYIKKELSQLDSHPQTIRILDLGTGAADIPRAIVQWARKKNISIEITGIDLLPDIIAIAKKRCAAYPEIRLQTRDFFDVYEKGEKFDFVVGAQFLHHIPPHQITPLFKAINTVATKGFYIADLHRTQLAYWSTKFISDLIGNGVIQNDAPLSVARAFQPSELELFLKRTDLSNLIVRKEPWFRLSLSTKGEA